jgi:hypothetical protein
MTDKLSPLQEELLKRADSIFESIAKTVTEAKNFAVEQLPDIAFQYIAFYRALYTFEMIVFVLLMVIGLYLLINISIRNVFEYKDLEYETDHRRFISGVAGGGMILVSFVVILNITKEFFMVWFAPKIFLIQTLVSLIKGGSV